MNEEHWTVADVAAAFGVKQSTVRAYLARQQIPEPDGKIGRTVWWRPETIREWRKNARKDKKTPTDQQ